MAPRLRFYTLIPLALLGLGLALDSLSTYLALVSGNASEGNPLLTHLFSSSNGFLVFLLLKVLGLLLAIYIARLLLPRALWRQLLYALLLTFCAAVFLFTSLSNLSLAFFGHGFFPF